MVDSMKKIVILKISRLEIILRGGFVSWQGFIQNIEQGVEKAMH